MSDNLVSIISVNYNEPEETEAFLESVYQSDYTNLEVIIVDNGSQDRFDPKSYEKLDNFKYICSEENLGFAGGNNLGIARASGDYYLFLNNDTLLPPNFITTMVDAMSKDGVVGIASPKVIYPDGIIQYAGAIEMNPLTGRGKRLGLFENDHGQYDKIYDTDLPHGAAMMVSKEALSKVGSMPEEYFLYYEEHDWCTQIKRAGFKMRYVGTTHIVHKESVSVGTDSPLKVYYLNRNRILYQVRNFTGVLKWSGIAFFCFVSLPKSTLTFLIKGKMSQLKSLWRGVLWHLNKKYAFKA